MSDVTRKVTLSLSPDLDADDPLRRLEAYRVYVGPGIVRLAFPDQSCSAYPTGTHDEDGCEFWEIRRAAEENGE